jgi:hypothetical protein
MRQANAGGWRDHDHKKLQISRIMRNFQNHALNGVHEKFAAHHLHVRSGDRGGRRFIPGGQSLARERV